MSNRITIQTEEQLLSCIHSGVEIEVWIDGQFETACKIIGYTDSEVRTTVGSYSWASSILKLRDNYLDLT